MTPQPAPRNLDNASGLRHHDGMPTIKDPTTERANSLRKSEGLYERSAAKTEELRRARNAMIFDAIDAGWTHAQIAHATGLTRGRVGQIMMGRDRAPEAPTDA